jgi:MSHA biogenesis protein MshK
MARYLVLVIAALSMVEIAGFAALEPAIGNELPDPTRPPAALINPSVSGGGVVEDLASGPTLQSVILRKGQKPAAIISGERVELGGRYGDARLTKVSESRVVLSGASGNETLLLTPSVEKKMVVDTKKTIKGKTSHSKENNK